MRSMVWNVAGGLVFAACLVAGLPVVAEDPSDDVRRAGSAAISAEPSDAASFEAGGSPEYAVVAPKDLKDVALANNPRLTELSRSVAANPKDSSLLVAALSKCPPSGGCRSVVYRSRDAGQTWSQPVALPCISVCGRAALAYAPNGEHVYVAYSNGDNDSTSIVVSSSDDNGTTWGRPVVALSEPWAYYGYARIATPLDESESRWIYVTGRLSYGDPSGDFDFTRSADFGVTWSTPQSLGDWTSEWSDGLTDGTVAGGKAGEVLVAGPGTSDYGSTRDVWVARSRDHGGKFVTVVAAKESPYSIDVKIGYKGAAHVVYQEPWPAEDDFGDIKYIWSPGPPYTTWSKPITVNDDGAGRSQLNPSLTTQKCGASTVLHLVWEDARLRPMADCYNDGYSYDCYWDVFYARKIAKLGAGWSKNVRVSGKSSLTGVDLFPNAAASQGRMVTIWTDRRDKTDPYDYETDAYASGLLSGVTCP